MERDFARPYYEPEPVDESPRPKQSWKRAIIVLLAVLVGVPLITFVPQILLRQAASGKVTFGSSVLECRLDGQSSTFASGAPVYGVVLFERGVSPGDVVTVRLLGGDTELATTSFGVIGAGTCESELFSDGSLPPGLYRVTYSSGDELLAEGSFTVT